MDRRQHLRRHPTLETVNGNAWKRRPASASPSGSGSCSGESGTAVRRARLQRGMRLGPAGSRGTSRRSGMTHTSPQSAHTAGTRRRASGSPPSRRPRRTSGSVAGPPRESRLRRAFASTRKMRERRGVTVDPAGRCTRQLAPLADQPHLAAPGAAQRYEVRRDTGQRHATAGALRATCRDCGRRRLDRSGIHGGAGGWHTAGRLATSGMERRHD